MVPNNNNGDVRSFPFCEGNAESEIRISMQIGLPDCRELEWWQRGAAELKSVLNLRIKCEGWNQKFPK